MIVWNTIIKLAKPLGFWKNYEYIVKQEKLLYTAAKTQVYTVSPVDLNNR